MSSYRTVSLVAAVAAAALITAGCGKTSPGNAGAGSSPSGAASPSASATLVTHSTSIGTVLADGSTGKTIYMLTADGMNHRSCSSACLQYWPPVMVSGSATAGSGVTAKLGTIAVSGGEQLTVDGHPAYTYVGDSGAGSTSGEGIKSYGGTWWAFSPAGAEITSSGSQSSSSGGGYYGGGY